MVNYDYESTTQDLSYSLFHQLSRITYERGALKHDDRLDALAIMVHYWVEHMAVDAERTERDRLAKAMEKELNEWFSGMGYADPARPQSWLNW